MYTDHNHDLQKLFDYVATNLLEQGEPSCETENLEEGGGEVSLPRYRDSKGNKCAAGWLLSDEEAKALEGGTVSCAWAKARRKMSALNEAYSDREHALITALQSAHDKVAEMPLFSRTYFHTLLSRELRVVAERFGLSDAALARDPSPVGLT